jgi:ArsR family metal-binding transcriptional regulator
MAEKPLIEDYEIELEDPACLPGAPIYAAKAHIHNDVSEVMPYLNAVLERAQYGADNRYIIWKEGDRAYALRPHELAVSMIWERQQAYEFVEKAIARINEIWERRDKITPDYTPKTKPRVLDILKLLPKTNCGECGLQSCMAFAAELVEGNRFPEDCPPLAEDKETLARLEELGL